MNKFTHKSNVIILSKQSFGELTPYEIRMAVALYNRRVPFILHKGEAILKMVTGEDYIGIVPDHVFPRYCHRFFPAEDRIIDFMNLGHENVKEIIKNAFWYPLKPVLLLS
jgi:hypothetical protein